MRRLVVALISFFTLALVVGLFSSPPALSASGQRLSDPTLRANLSAITSSANAACYESALTGVLFRTTRSPDAVTATAVAAFAKDWLIGETALHEVTVVAHRPLTRADLAAARASVESTARSQAAVYGLNCPSTPADFLDSLPAPLREAMIAHAAAVAIVVNSLSHAGPLGEKEFAAYYAAHTSNYDTLCIAIAVVAPTQEQAFTTTAASGASVGTLARAFSQDPSSHRGGAYGCWAPSTSQYQTIRTAVSGVADNTFSAGTKINYQGVASYLHIAVTSRTTNPYSAVSALVATDATNAQSTEATTALDSLLYTAPIAVGTHVGRWALIDARPTVAPLAQPALTDVLSGAVSAGKTPKTPYH